MGNALRHVVGKIGEELQQPLPVRHAGNHPVMQPLRALELDRFGLAFPLRQLVGEQLAEQLDRGAFLEIDVMRRAVVAGQQAPQLAPPQDRHGHGGLNPHVPQVFQMDGRHGPGRGQRQVQRLPLGVHRRGHGRNRRVHIGDQAQQVAGVERAGLFRDVRGREPQAPVAFQRPLFRLGHDLSAVIGGELVHHHAVEPADHADALRGLVQHLLHRAAGRDSVNQRLHRAQIVAVGAQIGLLFDLQHEGPARLVDGGIEPAAISEQVEINDPDGRILMQQALHLGPHLANGHLGQQVGHGHAVDLLCRLA